MPETTYLLAVMAITFSITFALRAVPFAVLGTLQESALVEDLSRWMPAGVLGILAVTAFRGSVVGLPGSAIYAALALAVTVAVHLLSGRRTLLSVTLGTATFVGLVNLL
jgi:branched-subunit amino acid transport protein AzlD